MFGIYAEALIAIEAERESSGRSSRNVGQPDHILGNPIISHQTKRRPRSGEIRRAVTKHDGVQVDAILIDQAEFGKAVRQARASHFDLPVVPTRDNCRLSTA